MRACARLLLLVVGLLLVSSSVHAILVHLWSKSFGDGNIQYNNTTQYGNSVATDGSGNVIIVGQGSSFSGSADFGGGPLTGSLYIAKLDPSGSHVWSKVFGDFVIGNSVAVDGSGNIVVTGTFSDVVDFGGGPLTSTLGSRDYFVVKFDANGNHLWSKSAGDSDTQVGNSVAVDGSGNVVVSGYFQGTMNLGGDDLTSPYSLDIFVGKYDASGNHLWSKSFGGVADQLAYSVDTDGSGNIIMTGEFESDVDFGGGVLTSASFFDVFVVKFDADGNHVWSNGYGGSGIQRGYSVVADASGNVLITGLNDGSVDFGDGPLTTAGSSDILVAKFDANGNHLWSQCIGDANYQEGRSVATDGAGNVAVIGTFTGKIFVRLFDAGGSPLWSPNFGNPVFATCRGVAVDGSNNIFIIGDFEGTVDFGGGPLKSPVFSDIFLAKFDQGTALPVLFTSFEARASGAAVEVRWGLWSDESLYSFTLYRREDSEPLARVIAGDRLDITTRSYIDTGVEPGKTYSYELLIRTRDGDELRSPAATATVPAVVNSLGQNHPNPFNPTTTIEYTLAEPSRAMLNIYDASGALVVRLDDGTRGPGTHRLKWDGRDGAGKPVGSGVYFYRLEGMGSVTAKKMVLLK